jgi:hypothetical protein
VPRVNCRGRDDHLPIVSARVASVQDEIEHRETNAPRAFKARCRLCEYETAYTISDVHGLTENCAREFQDHEQLDVDAPAYEASSITGSFRQEEALSPVGSLMAYRSSSTRFEIPSLSKNVK